jgi:hypothetical protein
LGCPPSNKNYPLQYWPKVLPLSDYTFSDNIFDSKIQ